MKLASEDTFEEFLQSKANCTRLIGKNMEQGKEATNRDNDQGTTESSIGKQTRQKQLTDELLVDIISRLSTEDLGRCNCVSKLWNYTLTIQAFMLRHARASVPSDTSNVPGRITTLFRNWPSHWARERKPIKLLSIEIPTEVDTSSMNLTDGRLKNIPKLETKFQRLSYVYDGLACFWKCVTVTEPRSEFSIVLYSIKTNDFIALLMTTNYDFKNPLIKGVETSCSVGFDTLTKEYIIFRKTSIEMNDKTCRMSYETLTLGSRSWNLINDTKVPLSLSQGCGSFDVREICLDGVIYWIHNSDIKFSLRKGAYLMGSFDLSNKEFGALDIEQIMQESSPGQVKSCHLASLRGCPTIFVMKYGHDKVIMCTLSDHKTANAGWTRTISIFNPSELRCIDAVCEGRFIISYWGMTMINSDGLFQCCLLGYDLENDLRWAIGLRNTKAYIKCNCSSLDTFNLT